jgi:hypothetical protein
MKSAKLTEADLQREISDYRDSLPTLSDDHLFVLFFLRAFVTDDVDAAVKSLCGGSNDKGTDAALIDDVARVAFLLQGKYRKQIGEKTESRNDVLGLAHLGVAITSDDEAFKVHLEQLSPETAARLEAVRSRLHRRGYRLQLFYVTTGRCSAKLVAEAERLVRVSAKGASLQVFDGRQVMQLLSDYLDGVAPPVASLDLELESGRGISSSGVLQRVDGKTGIESWIFSMSDVALASVYQQAGTRLFARNVRGFLGSTEINRGMEATLRKEPQRFWYYNNGVTMVCDDAKRQVGQGRDFLRVTNPQIINGQQTTRTLAREAGKTARASVLVRVIRVPRGGLDGPVDQFDSLVSRIVQATNWQNAIRPSDLMANDRRQIEIERQLRKCGYWYVRKRQTKGEARRLAGSRRYIMIKKEEVAQAVAACDLDPAIVREGKEYLFEERWYSHVFPTADPYYYLTRYKLMREVGYAAKGYPERAYAKWLVLRFMWGHLQRHVRSRASAEAFTRLSERNGQPLLLLNRACNHAFRGALAFFRKRRGKGERAQDVSTFFQRKGLEEDLARFWAGSGNPVRGSFRIAWLRFEHAFRASAPSR